MHIYKEEKIVKEISSTDKKSLELYMENLIINIKEKDSQTLEFDLRNCHSSLVNGIRRSLMTEVETIAFHKIEIHENRSIFPDEFLAHRIGLIPIKFQNEETNEIEKLKFTLNVNNNTNENINIYSDSIKGDSSIYIKPGVLLCKLAPKNEISLILSISKGNGKKHAKWSPVSHCSFRLMPKIEFLRSFNEEESNEIKNLFSPGVLDVIDGKLVVANPRLEMMNREFLRHKKYADFIKLTREPDWYIFTIETIIEDPIIILRKAIVSLKNTIKLLSNDVMSLNE